MFEGFTDETEAFFAAIRFNNNTDFFHANHDWYERAVRAPMKALLKDLSPAIELFDPRLDRRPVRVISRISRDMRYAHNMPMYRDNMWLGFRRADTDRDGQPGLYFDISADGAGCGMGFYLDNKPLMNGLRRSLREDPAPFMEAAVPALRLFQLEGSAYKRMAVPEDLPDIARAFYPMRSFWLTRSLDYETTHSPALVSELERSYMALKPLYWYLCEIEPVTDEIQP